MVFAYEALANLAVLASNVHFGVERACLRLEMDPKRTSDSTGYRLPVATYS